MRIESGDPPLTQKYDYVAQLTEAMTMLGQNPKTLVMGQAVASAGTAMTQTFSGVPRSQLLELPVFEDCQMGMAIGMALGGYLPVCVFPRWNFLLLATSQLVLHLDKLPIYSNGGYRPKVIIRTAVATDYPLDPGPQHLGNFSEAYRSMLTTVVVDCLYYPHEVVPAYRRAMEREGSSLIVEFSSQYGP